MWALSYVLDDQWWCKRILYCKSKASCVVWSVEKQRINWLRNLFIFSQDEEGSTVCQVLQYCTFFLILIDLVTEVATREQKGVRFSTFTGKLCYICIPVIWGGKHFRESKLTMRGSTRYTDKQFHRTSSIRLEQFIIALLRRTTDVVEFIVNRWPNQELPVEGVDA
jgi:hypothetical protein